MLIVNPHRPFTRLKLPRRLRQRREHAHLTLPLSLTQLRILSTGSDTARIFALSIRIDAEDYLDSSPRLKAGDSTPHKVEFLFH